jgi:nicotinate-nucleotide adenylyltransferase
MNKIAVFGGSFDPVHKSHIQIAKFVLNFFELKKLIFVIAYSPPHKIKQYACVDDRIVMLKLAAGNLEKTEISLYEVQRRETVYSYQTLDYLQSLYSKDEIYMVIGSDSLLDLSAWGNIDYLTERYKFIVAKRSGIKINEDTKYLDKCVFIDQEIENISSTKIRELIKKDSTKIVPLLDEKVYNYIIKNGIYK